MALKMNAQRQSLRDLLVPGGPKEEEEIPSGITPPHSETLSPPYSQPPSPEDHVYATDVSILWITLSSIMKSYYSY